MRVDPELGLEGARKALWLVLFASDHAGRHAPTRAGAREAGADTVRTAKNQGVGPVFATKGDHGRSVEDPRLAAPRKCLATRAASA